MFPDRHTVPLLVLILFIPIVSPAALSFDRAFAHLTIETPPPPREPHAGAGFSIGLNVRTNERDGLILSIGAPPALSFALELFSSHLFVVVALSSGRHLRHRLWEAPVLSDGRLHVLNLTLDASARTLSANIDDSISQINMHEARALHENAERHLFVGWHPDASALPKELYTSTLNRPFRGCVENLIVDGKTVDLTAKAEAAADAAISIVDSCDAVPLEPLCPSAQRCPDCVEGWRRTLCDCAFGDCNRQTLTFDPSAASRGRGRSASRTSTTLYSWTMRHDEVTELAVRFRSMRANGLLFAVTGADSRDSLDVHLENGALVVQSDLGNGTWVCGCSALQ